MEHCRGQRSLFLRPPAHFSVQAKNKAALLFWCLDQQSKLVFSTSCLLSELIFYGMAEQNNILPRPIFRRDVTWDPLPLSHIFAQDFSLPPFLEPSDREWIDWAKRRLESFSWPGSTQSLLLPPFSGQHTAVLNQKGPRQLASGVSEIRTGQDSWKINLDVNHFSPEEITITTKEGYLLISGIQGMFL